MTTVQICDMVMILNIYYFYPNKVIEVPTVPVSKLDIAWLLEGNLLHINTVKKLVVNK